MINKILHTIQCHNMLAPNDKVVIGLSGGADSMALAFFLNSLRSQWNLTIQVAHVNHGIRGAEADRDEKFVVDWCEKNKIQYKVLHADVLKIASEQKISTELCGRNVRYEFFNSFGDDWKIATAHNLNDCMETVLFNITRGTSMSGVRGIPPVRGNIVRPLIGCSRAEIEEFCTENKINFVIDSTNLGNDYSRNHIRNKVVPLLKELNPSVENAFSRLSDSAKVDGDYLATLSNILYEKCFFENSLKAEFLENEDFALRSRVIERFIKSVSGVDVNNKLVFQIDKILLDGGKMQIDRDFFIKKFKNKIIIEKTGEFKCNMPEIVNKLNVTSKDFFNNKDKYKKSFDFCGDYDKIRGNIKVRSRQEGEKISISGRNCTKTLKKYFNEIGIMQSNREFVPVLSDDEGVIAVAGYAVDRRVEISESTENVLLLKLGELK